MAGEDGLPAVLARGEQWLVRRVLGYALRQGYSRYTSTLEEAWRASVAGLSAALAAGWSESDEPREFGPDDDFASDPIAAFGVLEARRHRERGVPLGQFLGLMKYYQQSYTDLLDQAGLDSQTAAHYRRFVDRFFDRVELAFCTEWAAQSEPQLVRELQAANLEMTNLKNRYLTVFESLVTPVFILDDAGRVVEANRAAASTFHESRIPGAAHYGSESGAAPPPWLARLAERVPAGQAAERETEITIETPNGPRTFSVRIADMLDVSGKFTGRVIGLADLTDRKALEEELRRLSSSDPLTGLANRRGLEDRLAHEWRRAQRSGRVLSVVMIDVDHFKAYNDACGHLAGDECLKRVAEQLRHSFRRAADLPARWGGEEFAVVVDGELEDVAGAADSFRCAVEAQAIPHPAADRGVVTVSVGVAAGMATPQTLWGVLLEAADRALYAAKAAGRNQVVAADASADVCAIAPAPGPTPA